MVGSISFHFILKSVFICSVKYVMFCYTALMLVLVPLRVTKALVELPTAKHIAI